MTSSGKGTNETRTSDVSWPASLRIASSRNSSSSLARIRVPSGLHATYDPAYLASSKVEKGDIEKVVGEFREFLENAVHGDGNGQSTILEIQ